MHMSEMARKKRPPKPARRYASRSAATGIHTHRGASAVGPECRTGLNVTLKRPQSSVSTSRI